MPNPPDDGPALRARRLAARLSVKELADRSGLSVTMLKYVEAGKRHLGVLNQRRVDAVLRSGTDAVPELLRSAAQAGRNAANSLDEPASSAAWHPSIAALTDLADALNPPHGPVAQAIARTLSGETLPSAATAEGSAA